MQYTNRDDRDAELWLITLPELHSITEQSLEKYK